MTHYQILFYELTLRGAVTYRELMARYGERGYTRSGFAAAVRRARKTGWVFADRRQGQPIVAAGPCVEEALTALWHDHLTERARLLERCLRLEAALQTERQAA